MVDEYFSWEQSKERLFSFIIEYFKQGYLTTNLVWISTEITTGSMEIFNFLKIDYNFYTVNFFTVFFEGGISHLVHSIFTSRYKERID